MSPRSYAHVSYCRILTSAIILSNGLYTTLQGMSMPLAHEYYGFDNDVYSMWCWEGVSVVVVQNKRGDVVIVDVQEDPVDED